MKKLTISQALRRRRQLKGTIAVLVERLDEALVYNQEQAPTFSFKDSEKAMRAARLELVNLEDGIAKTNAHATVTFEGDRVALTWVLRVLAEIKGDIRRYENYANRGLKAQRETTETVEEPILGEVFTITQPDGSTKRSYAKKTVTKVTISNITERERADKIEQLKSAFETLNDLLEVANHETIFEYDDQPEVEADSGAAPQTP